MDVFVRTPKIGGRASIQDDEVDEIAVARIAAGRLITRRQGKICIGGRSVIPLGPDRVAGPSEAAVEVAEDSETDALAGPLVDPALENRNLLEKNPAGFTALA